MKHPNPSELVSSTVSKPTAVDVIISSATKSDSKATSSVASVIVPTTRPAVQERNKSIELLKEIFDNFDADKTGRINSSELERVLERLNVKLSKEAYDEILKEGDKDMSRDIDFDEFCKIMLPVFTGKFEDDELLYAFRKFDLDGSGYITASELRQILSKIGQYYSESEIEKMIAKVDLDKDGKLNFPEFAKLMKQPASSN